MDPEIRLKIEEFTLYPSRRGLYRGREQLRLTAKPFEVLVHLARNSGRVIPKDELLSAVWEGVREENTVEQAIRQIRRVLQDDKDQPRFIQTISGRGYCLIAAVREVGAADSDTEREEPDTGNPRVGVTEKAASAPATAEAIPPSGPSLAAKEQKPARRWTRRMVLGVGGVAGATAGVSLIIRSRVRRVERAVLNGNLLTALDGLGQTIWTHRFPGTLAPPRDDELVWRVQVLDLEGDGHPVVVTACRHAAGTSSPQSTNDEIVCIAADGQARWTYSCHPPLLDFDGQPFEPLWYCSHLIAVPHGKGQELWAGIRHGWRWPGCVMRLNAGGSPSLQFANSGNVERLCRLVRPDGECMAVAGENNAFDRSCTAVLGIHDPPSSSPPGGAKRCTFANAPSGSPRDYLLFPTTEIMRAVGSPYGTAQFVTATNDGGFVTYVVTSVEQFLFEFSGRTEPRTVMPGSGYELAHRHLQAEGKLDHSWEKCPELAKPLTVRHWRPANGWRDESIAWRAVTGER